MTMQPTPRRQHQNTHHENANTTGAPEVSSAPVAACSGDEEVLEDSYEDEREREQKERDQYPNEMTAEEIDDVVERDLLEFEARYDRAHGADDTRLE
jgi:hypothetical protein